MYYIGVKTNETSQQIKKIKKEEKMPKNFRIPEEQMSPESLARSEAKAVHDTLPGHHEHRLKEYLRGKRLGYDLLWLSVEYFLNGAGKAYLLEEHPFTKEEWKKLLTDTNRPLSDPYLN